MLLSLFCRYHAGASPNWGVFPMKNCAPDFKFFSNFHSFKEFGQVLPRNQTLRSIIMTSPVWKAWLSHNATGAVSAIFPSFLPASYALFCAGISLEDWLKIRGLVSLWYLSRPGYSKRIRSFRKLGWLLQGLAACALVLQDAVEVVWNMEACV